MPIPTISALELNGIAKFFDAEGCVAVHQPYTHAHPVLLFYNNNKNLIMRIRLGELIKKLNQRGGRTNV